jgi:hypothetical protein
MVAMAVLLAVLYGVFFTDWFRGGEIQIRYRSLPDRKKPVRGVQPVTFYLDKEYPLTAIKVFSADEAKTNRYPPLLWHMVPETNAAPVDLFIYGRRVKGMKPAIARTTAEPLQPNTTYRIVVESGKLRGEQDFKPRVIR